ncbi:ABC transporter substrate-binding protein [Limnochorda pilosa]|uniref:ABC transporter substrate-binding protein n=1 Tax=Limnochorda pilosa TaxID=1555112 RepID=A0A0K2SIL1_LIMPI|nr:ABC transporter substrate-binding protein [Limnochorda pilosa]BAS26930.1 ABC transporter substrate-binding protein [Limnochorda pilosa]
MVVRIRALASWLLLLLSAVAVPGPATAQQTPEVTFGLIGTWTGPTSDAGRHYADGALHFFRWLEAEQGGIVQTDRFGPVRVKLVWSDDQYNPQLTLSTFRQFSSQQNLVGLITWGTGPNLAIKEEVNKARVPTLSASFHKGLLDEPGEYDFFLSMTYDDHMQVLLDYVEQLHQGSSPPRVAFNVHPSPYGRSPLAAGKAYAEARQMQVVASQEMAADILDATSQVLDLRRNRAEYVLFQNVASPLSVFLRDARRNGLRATFLGIHYAGGEELLHLAGANADGFITTSASRTWYEDVPGNARLKQMNDRFSPEEQVRPPHYAQGAATAMVLIEALKRAPTLDGAGVKAGLETLRAFDPQGLALPVTFTPERHAGADQVLLYRLNARTNRLDFIGEFAPAH